MNRKKCLVGTLMLAAVVTLGAQSCQVPSWINTVETDAEIAVPIVGSIVAIADPALGPIVSLVEQGFTALTKTLDTYKSQPNSTNLQAIEAAVVAVNTNVAQLESAAQIKKQATDARITAIMNLIAQLTGEIVSQVPTSQAELNLIPRRVHGAHYYRSEYNRIVKGDGRFKPLQ